jgi:hypothetical protein
MGERRTHICFCLCVFVCVCFSLFVCLFVCFLFFCLLVSLFVYNFWFTRWWRHLTAHTPCASLPLICLPTCFSLSLSIYLACVGFALTCYFCLNWSVRECHVVSAPLSLREWLGPRYSVCITTAPGHLCLDGLFVKAASSPPPLSLIACWGTGYGVVPRRAPNLNPNCVCSWRRRRLLPLSRCWGTGYGVVPRRALANPKP